MKYQELLDQASGEVDSAPEASDCSRAFSKVRRCCCLAAAALAGMLALQLVAWNQQAHCDVSGTEMVWSPLLPNKTTMQYHSPWFAHEVDVYGEAGLRRPRSKAARSRSFTRAWWRMKSLRVGPSSGPMLGMHRPRRAL